mgnify:CR=1 FL=1
MKVLCIDKINPSSESYHVRCDLEGTVFDAAVTINIINGVQWVRASTTPTMEQQVCSCIERIVFNHYKGKVLPIPTEVDLDNPGIEVLGQC